MRSSNRIAKRGLLLHLLVVAALVVVVRLPFLMRGDRFFDADEAVEGLMARHVLQGERPAFLWGQRYKGVPEVYLAAPVFAVTGSNVVALKSVTLACFTVFVLLEFLLVERLFSRPIAWLASFFLIVSPPALVLWSLSANAEIVMTMLAGTVMCLGFDRWRRTGTRAGLVVASGALGFGLWVQQFMLYYLVALAWAVLYDLPRRREVIHRFATIPDSPWWQRAVLLALASASAGYFALGTAAFVTGGFDVALGDRVVGIHHAQKLWQIAVALLVLTAGARALLALAGREGRPARLTVLLAVAAFGVGYLPSLAGRLAGGGSAPVSRIDLRGLAAAAPVIVEQIVPIVLGFRSPTTGWLGVASWLGLAIPVAIAASFVGLRRMSRTPFFHLVLVSVLLIFVLSGSFVDAQSYRYVMPAAGALAAVMAIGVANLFTNSRVAGSVLLAMLLVTFGLQERAWYRSLEPDANSVAVISCLNKARILGAYADYWVAYKVTFLTGERVIVAPAPGLDRHPAYTEFVRRQPVAPAIPATMGGSCDFGISSLR